MSIFNFDPQQRKPEKAHAFRAKLHEVIFEAETFAGKLFDVVLLVMILLSILLLMLETVPSLQTEWGRLFYQLEWIITGFFTLEYLLRLYCVHDRIRYARSFFGLIDILSILPVYLGLFFPGAHSLMVIRSLRLLRIFRIFKLNRFLQQGYYIIAALRTSWTKISIFMFFVVLMVCISGSVIYLVEHPVNPQFDSIPTGIYWSIVTITTVGYGDVSPITGLGKFIASLIMILGYAVIAVPTGIVTTSMMSARKQYTTRSCQNCSREGHDEDAVYCKYCAYELDTTAEPD